MKVFTDEDSHMKVFHRWRQDRCCQLTGSDLEQQQSAQLLRFCFLSFPGESTNRQIHLTQIHKYTIRQIHKCTNKLDRKWFLEAVNALAAFSLPGNPQIDRRSLWLTVFLILINIQIEKTRAWFWWNIVVAFFYGKITVYWNNQLMF